MGKSTSIKQLEEKEDEYRAYLKKLETELHEKFSKSSQEMLTKINEHYNHSKWTYQDFVSGMNSDFMQKSDWSLANLKAIIESIGKAIFGDSTPPPGVDIKSIDMGKAISEMANWELYISSKCFQVLSGILDSFGSTTSLQSTYQYKDEKLGNGLHLFVTVSCDSYKSQSFFNNEEIYEYLYQYEVKYSQDEASQDAALMITKGYEDQVAAMEDALDKATSDFGSGTITFEEFKSKSNEYQDFIDKLKVKLDSLRNSPKQI